LFQSLVSKQHFVPHIIAMDDERLFEQSDLENEISQLWKRLYQATKTDLVDFETAQRTLTNPSH
jgi:hypothetical protein